MEEQKKQLPILKIIVVVLFTAGTIVAYVFSTQLFGENSIFNTTISGNATLNTLYTKIPALIRSVQIVVLALWGSYFIRLILRKWLTKSKRGITIVKLLDSFIKWVIAILALMLILAAWGIDTTTLLAGAGILTLVVGLGVQSLVADIVAGIFIVFEGEYQVGDIVVIDDWRGTVQEIGIRTTKIMDAGGNIKIVNNSEIKSIINQTQEFSVAKCTVSIEYGESIPRVEIIIRDNLEKIKERIPGIVDGPFYKGVSMLNSSSVDLLFVANCKEEDIYQVQRDLNREIKIMFDENNINIPFPQIVLNQPSSFEKKATKKMESGAREFVEEQKEASKGIEDKEN